MYHSGDDGTDHLKRKVLSRRDFARVAVGITGLVLAAACAGPTAPPSPTAVPKPTPQPTTAPQPAATTQPTTQPTAAPKTGPAALKGARVHLLNWSSFVPEEDQWLKETLVAQWARPNGVELTVELVAGNQVQPKVAAALQAGAGPDILQMQWTWAHLYADKLLDVSDIAEPAGTAGGGWYDAAKQNNFVQGRWRAVPFGLVGNAIAYRESYLKEGAGVDKFPATWEEYTTVGRAVKEKKNS
ncbi:MAG TPA: extracellular solute-binding protein, partial [Chloroflexota bacterium]